MSNIQNISVFREFLQFLARPIHFNPSLPLSEPHISRIMGGFAIIFLIQLIGMGIIQSIVPLEESSHALQDMMEANPLNLFLTAVILAPIVEEFIFRFPIKYAGKYLGIVFYSATLLFACLHIYNFDFSEFKTWMLPLLVFPQFILGLYLGFVRLKLNTWAGILVHAYNNAISLAIAMLVDLSGLEAYG